MAYAENASSWVGTLADARGRGYRSGQGLRRGILLVPEGGEKDGRQRKRISARARTPSGDTTKVP